MKKRKEILSVLSPVIITIGLYVGSYSRIKCNPSDAGFWLIIAMGMSIGVALTRFIQWSNTKKTDNE